MPARGARANSGFNGAGVGKLCRPSYFLKRTVYTNIDTSENAPDNQGAKIRVWDRSWRLRGWQTRILLNGETIPFHSLVVPIAWINFSQKMFDLHPKVREIGEPDWMTAPVVIFPDDVSEQAILECGRSLC